MEHYNLRPDETLLFEDSGSVTGTIFGAARNSQSADIILTNLNLVLVLKTKKMFSKTTYETAVFPLSQVKIYNGEPQIKQKGTAVGCYLINLELKLDLDSILKAKKFVTKSYDVLTSKSVSQRGAGKVKGAIGLVDDTLGINTVDTVKNVFEKGVIKSILLGSKDDPDKESVKSIAEESVSVAKGSLSISYDEQSAGDPAPAPGSHAQTAGNYSTAPGYQATAQGGYAQNTVGYAPGYQAPVQVGYAQNSGSYAPAPGYQAPAQVGYAQDSGGYAHNAGGYAPAPGYQAPSERSAPVPNGTAPNSPETLSYNERLEIVAKMKSLVDANVLTQEEFEVKKKELLNL